ncbi:MAG: DinB family protein [Longimicrobiales bacterium]
MRALVISALLSAVAAPAFAQGWAIKFDEGEGLLASPGAQAPAHVASIRFTYDLAKGYITRSVEKVTDEQFAYQPTEEVRTFAGIVGHIADANYMFCSTAKGEENPNSREIESLTDKAELAQALAESFAYCDEAYAMSDEEAGGTVEMFGQTLTRLGVLSFNVTHDYEHYGNLVTYMRMNGVVPPSSEGMNE